VAAIEFVFGNGGWQRGRSVLRPRLVDRRQRRRPFFNRRGVHLPVYVPGFVIVNTGSGAGVSGEPHSLTLSRNSFTGRTSAIAGVRPVFFGLQLRVREACGGDLGPQVGVEIGEET